MKTIREIANELGVDKQKVYRFIKQNHINEAHHEALQRSGVKYYDEAAETLIKQGFSDETASSEAHHEAHQNRINCSYDSYLFDSYSDFTRDLGNNKPCIFTYGAKFGSKSGGHAVLAVGYVETTKYQYLRIADGWNDYLRYINFNGYDYTRKDGWSFSVSK